MTHIEDHCDKPSTFMRRVGAVWACDCGKSYRLDKISLWIDSYKEWAEIDTRKKKK